MKTEGRVRHQLRQLIFRYRKTFIQRGLAPASRLCAHNTSLILYGKAMGVCGLGMGTPEWNRVACDDQLCPDVAKTCPFFQARKTPEELKDQFRAHMLDLLTKARNGDPGHLAHLYPDVAALQWVLGELGDLEGWYDLLQSEDEDDVSSAGGSPGADSGQSTPPDGSASQS